MLMLWGAGTLRAEEPPGLRVREGVFYHEGQRCRALGVNYFDCFTRTLVEDETEARRAQERYEGGFRELRAFGIPFVRFNAGGFYPKDWRLYQRDPEAYFARLDALVKAAETHGLGLIPSLFWSFFTPPVLAGEPLAAWGKPDSRTHAFMRRYVREVIGRYRHSPALWAWEFGNEYNLDVDLPNQRELLRRWYHPALGMPPEPGADDVLTSASVRTAWRVFAEAVREQDPERPVFTGNALPRSAAWHLEHEQSWAADTTEQWTTALIAQNPPSFSALSLHFYPFHKEGGVGLTDDPLGTTLAACAATARRTGQPLWIGEFGPAPDADATTRRAQFTTLLRLLEKHDVSLAAAWVYDFPAQPENNLTATGPHRALLEALRDTNARWRLPAPQ